VVIRAAPGTSRPAGKQLVEACLKLSGEHEAAASSLRTGHLCRSESWELEQIAMRALNTANAMVMPCT
jgi:hypothetical protein